MKFSDQLFWLEVGAKGEELERRGKKLLIKKASSHSLLLFDATGNFFENSRIHLRAVLGFPCYLLWYPFWQEIALNDLLKSGLSPVIFVDKLTMSPRNLCFIQCVGSETLSNATGTVWRKERKMRKEEKNSITSFIACSTCVLILNRVDLPLSSIFFRVPCCKRDPR